MSIKVLLGHNHYRTSAPSGEDTVCKNEFALLERHNIKVIPFEKFNDNLDDSTIRNKLSIAIDGAWSKNTYDELSQLIKETQPDIAHFHSIFPQISPSAYAACKDNGVPVVQTLHNFRPICPGALLMRNGKPCEDCIGTNLLPALKHRCYRGSLLATGAIVYQITRNRLTGTYNNLVDRYICLTEFAKGRYIAAGFPAEKMTVKPNFLPSNNFIQSNSFPPYAVFVGRLTDEKGVWTLLNAWTHISDLPLKIIGDGKLRNELEAYAIEHCLPVEFLGFRHNAEVLEIVGNATMQIIPSECYEGFPMVVLEAYGLGVPVVASRIGSLEEVVDEGVTGLKFKAGDPLDLSAKVNALKENVLMLNKMSSNAKKLYEEQYTADYNFKLLMSIYENVIAESIGGR